MERGLSVRRLAIAALVASTSIASAQVDFPAFKTQEVDKSYTVGYATLLVDVNHDKKTDIVVVDSKRVIWYENPTWNRRTIIEGQTKPDNVCISAADIDGDGLLDFALGADWRPADTKNSGSLQWLKRGKTLDDPWTIYPIGNEPTLHRIRFADLDGTGRPLLIVGPLFGRGSSRAKNWMDRPLRLIAFHIPRNPTKDRWLPEIIDESLHVMHNFWPFPVKGSKRMDILTASYEGVHRFSKVDGKWRRIKIGSGNQENPQGRRGASEVKLGHIDNGKREVIATIEPWHGHEVVVYTPPKDRAQTLWDRHVIDNELRWGHAVWFADLDRDGSDELIIGVRDDPNKSDTFKWRRGVRIYKALDKTGTKWARKILENGDMACEDLAAADLDGDGYPEIVAVGRQTHNLRIYWNKGRK
ncbi:MAG: hypothetical protein KatS3mg105_1840 [Gemmatales bacterium]|nr:MAG: hypothetical protein KatS3mg105_1840 [Gemmatales bacterium]